MKASAIANANIALIKYWGKRNSDLILPHNSSISMTTDNLYTHTTIEFSKEYDKDIIIINNILVKDNNIARFLNIIRKQHNISFKAKIQTENNFPTAAGLASSASGFAALTMAINQALNLNLSNQQLSILARQGSGSACRSIQGGFNEWLKGEKVDGSDSYAKQLYDENYWPELRMIICITSEQEKHTKSRAGMKQTVNTSPLYKNWLNTIDTDLNNVRTALKNKDFTLLGKTAEHNCLKMHETMRTAVPPIEYWNETTKAIINKVKELRKNNLECYFTIDAGPQVKILCLEKDKKEITTKCKTLTENIILTKPGKDTKSTNNHLF